MSCHCLINNSDYRVLTIPVQMLSQEQWVSHWKGVAALLALPLGSQQWTQPEGTDNRVHRTHRPLPALHHGTWLSHPTVARMLCDLECSGEGLECGNLKD